MLSNISVRFFPNIKNSIFIIGSIGALALSGCVTPQTSTEKPSVEPTVETVKQTSNYVEGLGYRYTWMRSESRLISPPIDVKAEATKICVNEGFDISFMKTISFTETEVVGYFSCRGQGNN